MSTCDQYQDLLLYLKQTGDEINKVFDKGAQNFNSELPRNDEIKIENGANVNEDDELDKIDTDYMVLDQQLNDIKLQISQLLAKNKDNGETEAEFCHNDYTDISYINSKLISNIYNNFNETDILSTDSLLSEHNVDAYTQTSPSLSPSSTNLTWPTEFSSSSCLTSDSDLLDEDAHSTSSADGKDIPNSHPRCYKILSAKSSSAPMLKKVPIMMTKYSRSQSDRHLAEIEAEDACKWLRATGFPQYAQMYEDMQFPIDVAIAGQDHPNLGEDILHSLFRRLQILNNCAHLHHQQRVTTHTDESEDECCALSDNWTYQSDIRRWSRNCKSMHVHSDEASQPDKAKEKEQTFERSNSACTRDRPRRGPSTKLRRRALLLSERDSIIESASDPLSELKNCEVNHVSDSEITPTHMRRSRAKSFDKSETWSLPNAQTTSIWYKPSETVIYSPETEEPVDISGPSMSSLSCSQLQVLKKLALLKLTALIEKYCPSQRTGWNWELPKFIRIKKTPTYKDKTVFGVPLTLTYQKTGQILPKSIEEALIWLQNNATDQVGIFRKPGVKSRIQILRNIVETSQEIVNYNEYQHFDIADMLKQYFRELPDALLTNKFSETFILIFQYIPPNLRREAILCSLLLIPDEHIEVLQVLLHFLLQVSKEAAINQMNESNLAMCFAPSLFHYSQSYKHNIGSPHPKELAENKAGHECLLYFLKNYNSLFNIPKEFIGQCENKEPKIAQFSEMGKQYGGYQAFFTECQQNFLKEVREKSKGYISVPGHNSKIDISFKKVEDRIPLRLWRVSAEIEAPPSEVLNRILRERHIWDPELHSTRIIEQIDNKTEIFQFVRKSISPLPKEDYCVVRTWKTDLPKDSCMVIEMSVEHPDAITIPNVVRGVVLASRYLIEPCGSGKSKILHLSRVDTMGRTPEWYQNNYGHLCALFIANIQSSFSQHNSIGPESKV